MIKLILELFDFLSKEFLINCSFISRKLNFVFILNVSDLFSVVAADLGIHEKVRETHHKLNISKLNKGLKDRECRAFFSHGVLRFKRSVPVFKMRLTYQTGWGCATSWDGRMRRIMTSFPLFVGLNLTERREYSRKGKKSWQFEWENELSISSKRSSRELCWITKFWRLLLQVLIINTKRESGKNYLRNKVIMCVVKQRIFGE